MELSGVDRLLAYAKELGVREPRAATHSDKPHLTREEPTHASQDGLRSESGLKLSLSTTAIRLSKDPANVEITIRNNAPHPSRGPRTESTPHQRNRAVAAYQRNASAIPGERVRVLA